MPPLLVSRGDIWIVDFEPGVTGHEQGGQPRPCVVVSSSDLDANATGIVIVVPSTISRRPKVGEIMFSHHQVEPSKQNGLASTSYFMCEQVRGSSIKRLGRKIGILSQDDLYAIEDKLAMLLEL